jgi:hypothetical protein
MGGVRVLPHLTAGDLAARHLEHNETLAPPEVRGDGNAVG